MGYIYKLRRKLYCHPQSLGVIALICTIGTIITLAFLQSNVLDNPEDKDPYQDENASNSPIWIRISDSVHVYSAFFDPRIKYPQPSSTPTFSNANLTLVRIIGIKRFPPLSSIPSLSRVRIKEETYFQEEYECKLFLPEDASSSSSPYVTVLSSILTYQVVEEGIKKFATCFFNCYFNLTMHYQLSPFLATSFVALLPKNGDEYPNKLLKVEVHFPKIAKKLQKNPSLAICVRPLFSTPEQDAKLRNKLIQFVSYYVSMGVGTFNFYELTTFPKIRTYLTRFSQRYHDGNGHNHFRFGKYDSDSPILPTVTNFRWNLPTGNWSELWDFGSLAALNDCLYRNMGSDHVLFLDVDEFIVPQQEEYGLSMGELINYLEKVGGNGQLQENGSESDKLQILRPPAQIMVRNTFFCSEFCQNISKNDITPPTFPISTCTTRTKRVWNESFRTKFIVRPTRILSVGHHTAHNFWKDDNHHMDQRLGHKNPPNSITAHPSLALLNHYRDCGPISTRKHPIFNRLTVKDEQILKILRNKEFKWFLP